MAIAAPVKVDVGTSVTIAGYKVDVGPVEYSTVTSVESLGEGNFEYHWPLALQVTGPDRVLHGPATVSVWVLLNNVNGIVVKDSGSAVGKADFDAGVVLGVVGVDAHGDTRPASVTLQLSYPDPLPPPAVGVDLQPTVVAEVQTPASAAVVLPAVTIGPGAQVPPAVTTPPRRPSLVLVAVVIGGAGLLWWATRRA